MAFRRLLVLTLILVAAASAYGLAQGGRRFVRYELTPIPIDPCGFDGLAGAAQPILIDGELWLFATCQSGQVQAYRFLTPDVVPTPAPLPPPTCAHIPGFVPSRAGGCVPPDHPDAAVQR